MKGEGKGRKDDLCFTLLLGPVARCLISNSFATVQETVKCESIAEAACVYDTCYTVIAKVKWLILHQGLNAQ